MTTGRPTMVYKLAGQTIAAFHRSNAFVRLIVGPRASGKSTACCWEIVRRANAQRPFHGVRRSRWAVVRNTYPELEATTIKTWTQQFPEPIFHMVWGAPIACHAKYPLPDGTDVDLEVLFFSMDKPQDERKLLSLELTGVYFNEFRFLPKALLDQATLSVGRFPSKELGGHSWAGVIGDTNPPDDDSEWYTLIEEQRPDGFAFFKQPGAMIGTSIETLRTNPDAENVQFLTDGFGYYRKAIAGKSWDWIKVNICSQYGSHFDGRPVYSEYVDSVHCAKEPLEVWRGLPLIIGMDFGLTPAAILCQETGRGQFRAVDEVVATDVGLTSFLQNALGPRLRLPRYSGLPLMVQCDPAGKSRMQTDEQTCIQILERAGYRVQPAGTNSFAARREAVAQRLMRMIDGTPGLLISPSCQVLRKGFQGGYRFRRVQVAGEERFQDEPDKNRFSHPHDALQYAAMAGEMTVRQAVQSAAEEAAAAARIQARPVNVRARMGAWS